MSVYKNGDNGTWYVMTWFTDWKGERRQKCKRGFTTKREAQEWERIFQLQNSRDMDMTFEAFTELYEKDIRPRLKENTWLTKEHIIRTGVGRKSDTGCIMAVWVGKEEDHAKQQQ